MANEEKRGFNFRSIIMVLCCAIPMLLLLYFISGAGEGNFLGGGTGLFLLLCVGMHVLMLKFMYGGGHSQKDNESQKSE